MKKNIVMTILISALLTACASQQPYGYGYNDYGYNNGRTSKALIGGGVGAVAGAALGTAFGGNDLANAGLGALAGGAVGAAVGTYVDHKEQKEQQRQEYGWQQTPYYNNGYGR